ncbi:MAG TPA: ornithine cyclodeaminase family protein [bacterium]|nr:ornithine cyclodeaminase family protein [bacterium]
MTSPALPLWISEAEAASLVDMDAAIGALDEALRLEAAGDAVNMTKTHTAWPGGSLHAIGATLRRDGIAVTKTWVNTPRGSTPLVLLFDAAAGRLLAVLEAFALGQLRTSGISGIATRALARGDARTFAIIGTGEQALPQAAAVAAVRPIRSIRVFSRDAARREAFARRVEETLGIEASAASSVADAVRGADVVTLVTRATEPFLTSAMVGRGTHVNAVGAITPERAEFEPALLARCAVTAIDNLAQARALSAEFMAYFTAGGRDWSGVTPLSALVARGQTRPKDADLTLFKAMGMGISDLAVGLRCYRTAVERGIGRSIPHPERAALRLERVHKTSGGVER